MSKNNITYALIKKKKITTLERSEELSKSTNRTEWIDGI